MFSGQMGYFILIGAIGLISSLVSGKLKSKFAFYSKVHLRNGMTGAEIARKMLADNGHANAAAAAVAAHEVGHAVQHATAYSYLTMRSKLVPVVQVTSKMSQWVIMGGLVLMASQAMGAAGQYVAIAGLVMMGFATLFSFVTLPVEYDASNRALAWLKAKNMVTPEEYKGSEDALKWAARTYLVAAIGALASLLYWAMQILGRRD